MNTKYNKQIIINAAISQSGESDCYVSLAKRALDKGLPFEYIQVSDFRKFNDLNEFNNFIGSRSFYSGATAYCVDSEGKVTLAAKDLLSDNINKEFYSNVEELNRANLNKQKETLNKVDQDSRIYIFGHGLPGTNRIGSNREMIHYEQVSDIIKLNPNLSQYSNKPITISLISCYGAVDGPFVKSFAHKLSLDLAKKGVYAKVSARNDVMSVPDDLTYDFRKFTDGVHHSEIGKTYFETDPVTLKTLSRPAIYKDNIDSIIIAMDQAKDLYQSARTSKLKIHNGIANANDVSSYRETKSKLSEIAYDLAVDRNFHKDIGKDFEELNKMRWGKESSMELEKVNNIITKTLNEDIYHCLSKNSSIFQHKERQFNDILNPYPSEVKEIKPRLYRFEKILVKNIEETSKLFNSSTLQKIDAYANNAAKNRNPSNLGLYTLMEKYQVLTALKLLKYGINHESVDKFKTFEELNKLSSRERMTNKAINPKFSEMVNKNSSKEPCMNR